jgi:hypothetical protein
MPDAIPQNAKMAYARHQVPAKRKFLSRKRHMKRRILIQVFALDAMNVSRIVPQML